ncbi:MAG: DUF503 domain-containing protein [Deltaproteobacteria bacterium]|jgi:uncharacterized protein YlxP (DUF503 family)|nr:DUF503 domain-containing protein [Deltaproteobacteria bacterium]
MVVGLGTVTFRIHDCRSLKEKRSIVKSLIRKVRNNFNASVAEIGSHDIYQKAEIGFSMVGTDQRYINSKSDKILNMLEDMGTAEIVGSELEIMHV